MGNKKKPWESGPLAVSKNKKYLCNGDQPFFWLGDTAWLMLHRLSREEMSCYLQNRRDKGFTVIQMVAVHSLSQTNWYGQEALAGGDDFAHPLENSGFWEIVDDTIAAAESMGLYIGLLPCWGSIVKNGHLNMGNVTSYGTFLAKRYHKFQNLIWILGGDVRGDQNPQVWDALAGIFKQDRPDRLICFHPFGRTSSSQWFHDRSWLDINMFQSGHRRYDQQDLKAWDDLARKEPWYGEDNWRYVLQNHSLEPLRPVLDGEPSYELIPQGLHDPSEPFWQDHDVRRYAYWSVFAGACGFTYGDNAVMQAMKDCYNPAYGAKDNWDAAIHHPGSNQVSLLKDLMERFPYQDGSPRQDMLDGFEGEKYRRISVFAGNDYALCYDYTGRPFSLKLGLLDGNYVNAWWFDPSSGKFSFNGKLENQGIHLFTPAPRAQGQNDACLVLCSEGAAYHI